MCEIWGEGRRRTRAGVRAAHTTHTTHATHTTHTTHATHTTHTAPQPHNAHNARNAHNACRSARGSGPGRSPQQISSDNYLNDFKAFGPIMNGAKIIDEPSPTPKPPITSVTQWTPRYRRVTQINTMNVSAAAHSR